MKMEKSVIKILEELDKKGDEFTDKEELQKINIGKNKFGEVFNYLSHKRLVIGDNHGAKWRISPAEGRDYLLAFKKEKTQHEFNKMVAFTGSIIALIGIYSFIKDNFSFENYTFNFLVIKIIFFLLLIICIAPLVKFIISSWKEEMFDT